jgi:hypothetical protein
MRTSTFLPFLLLLSSGSLMAQFLPVHGYSSRLEPTSDPAMEVVKLTSVVQDTVFYNLYGGPNQEEARDFVETSDKGFLICGSSSSYGQGGSSVYIVKTDSMGRLKWTRTYGGINADRGMSIRNTPDHGAFIAGYSNSFGNFDYDAYCIRIDSVGNMLWYRSYDGGDWDFIYASDATADGGMVMVGETYSNTAGDADAYLMRVDTNGDTLWTRKFGTAYQEKFNAVIVVDNYIYAAGKLFDPATQMSRGFVARYAANGTLLDTLTLPRNGNWNYEINCISKAGGPFLFLSGAIVDPNASAGVQQSEFRSGIDTALTFQWIENPGFGNVKRCDYVFEDNRGHQMAVMTVTGGNGGTALFLADFFAGTFRYGTTYGGLGDELGVKGMITSRNRLAYLGNTYSWVGSWNNGDEDYWLVLFKADTLIDDHKIKYRSNSDTIPLSPIGVEENSFSASSLYPNPASKTDMLTLVQPSGEPFDSAELIDIQGRTIGIQPLEKDLIVRIELGKWSPQAGIYFVRLKSEHTTKTVKIAVQD